MAYLVAAAGFTAYFFVLALGVYFSGTFLYIKKMSKRDIGIISVLTICFVLFLAFLIQKERFVCYWDYGHYWFNTLNYKDWLLQDYKAAFFNIKDSVNMDDYNVVPSWILALPFYLCGSSYHIFIMLCVVLFYIPNVILIWLAMRAVAEKYELKAVSPVLSYFFVLTFGIALFPVLDGYVDIINMPPISLAYLLAIRHDFKRIDIKKDIALGMALFLGILLRRYFAYAIIGGGCFVFIYWFFSEETEGSSFLKSIKIKITDSLISVGIPAIFLLTFFSDFIKNSVLNNHKIAYSAYKSAGYFGEWLKFIHYYGYIFILLAFAGIIFGLQKRTRTFSIALTVALIISCSLFFRIQDMEEHHYYITVFPMLLFIYLGMEGLCAVKPLNQKNNIQKGLTAGLWLVICLNLVASFGGLSIGKGNLFVENFYVPRVNKNIDTLKDLQAYLTQLNEEGISYVYCLGSNDVLNYDMLFKLNAPDMNIGYELLPTNDIDLRDGFTSRFLDAKIILVCNPVQVHHENGQKMLIKLSEIMIGDNVFSRHYALTRTFSLQDDIELSVYIKTIPLDFEAVAYIQQVFDEIYPDYPELFHDKIQKYFNVFR